MDFTDTNACRKRLACGDCRSRPAWRAAMGAPEICPFAVESGQIAAPTPSLPTPSLPEKRTICAACEHFQKPACCNCPTARKDPARELSACRFNLWPKP